MPFFSNSANRLAVAGWDLLTLKTLIRWQLDVTWRSQFLSLTFVSNQFRMSKL